MRLDTIVAVAGILAVLFASIAKTNFATNLLGLAGWLSYTLSEFQQAAIELYGPANASGRGIINPTLGWLASVLAYLLFLIPVVASWQLWREWSGVDVRRWRVRTAALFVLLPVLAMAPWYLIVSRVPREVIEYASQSRNLSDAGIVGGGWDDAVLITSFVAGVGALLVAAWLASPNTPEATPIPNEHLMSGTAGEEAVDATGAESTRPGVGNSLNAKFLAIGGTAAVLLFSLSILPSEQPSRPRTVAEKAASNAAAIAGIRYGDGSSSAATDSVGSDENLQHAIAGAEVAAAEAAAAEALAAFQTQSEYSPRLTQIGRSTHPGPGCTFTDLSNGVVVGELDYGTVEQLGNQSFGVLRLGLDGRDVLFNINSDFYTARRQSIVAEGIIDVGPMIRDNGMRECDSDTCNSTGRLSISSNGRSKSYSVRSECWG